MKIMCDGYVTVNRVKHFLLVVNRVVNILPYSHKNVEQYRNRRTVVVELEVVGQQHNI